MWLLKKNHTTLRCMKKGLDIFIGLGAPSSLVQKYAHASIAHLMILYMYALYSTLLYLFTPTLGSSWAENQQVNCYNCR